MADEEGNQQDQGSSEDAPKNPDSDRPTPYKTGVHQKDDDRPATYRTKNVAEGQTSELD